MRSKDVPVILRPVLNEQRNEDDAHTIEAYPQQPARTRPAGVKSRYASIRHIPSRAAWPERVQTRDYGYFARRRYQAVTLYPAQLFGHR